MGFTSIQDFRSRATDADMQELEAYILAQPKKADAFPTDAYNFSYTSASTYLRSKGYLGGTRSASDDIPDFIISRPGERGEFVNRSFSVQSDILARFDRLAEDHWQYSKKAIINRLLDDALSKYGY